ncbi:acidic leucine-rich nuclear phosphoprotein 32-related protein 1-like [Toxotes jaculatrix]|uniref:acidic leucine-rich nuclear phosphoprotein 32-related protein 1-like n=1 Tax=Toxotes jaculatrix TaxID=941984 RepID=UPI001B3AF557|nr:acidic leucine-rich nuclear phosphoprotein 32-related protein 1-like [Toxotes jaculatrix]
MGLLRKYLWLWVIVGTIFLSVLICLIFLLINKCISRSGKHRISELQKRAVFSVESNKYQERNLGTSTPPLPPRTQFLTAEAQSYENLAEAPELEQSADDYEQALPDYEGVEDERDHAPSDYEEVEDGQDQAPDPSDYEEFKDEQDQDLPDYEEVDNEQDQDLPDYEEVDNDYEQALPDYEQALPDYEEALPDYEEALPDYEEVENDYEQAMPDYEQALDEQPDYVKVDDEVKILLPHAPHELPDPADDNTSTEDYDDIGGEDESQGEEDYDDVG